MLANTGAAELIQVTMEKFRNHESGRSRSRGLLIHRFQLAAANIGLDLLDNTHPAAPRRKVLLHLPVLVHLLLVEPCSESGFFLGRQLGNRLL